MEKRLFDLNGHPVRRRTAQRNRWSLSRPVIALAENGPFFLIRDACDSVFTGGGVGAGKSSSSMRLLMEGMLRLGATALLLTSKETDGEEQRRSIRRARRENDLVVFRPRGPHKINVIDYAARHLSGGGSGIEEVVDLYRVVISILGGDGVRAQVGEDIWDRARDNMTRFAVALLLAAGEELSVLNIAKLVASAPPTMAEVRRLERVMAEEIAPGTYFEKCWQQALRSEAANGVDVHTQDALIDYWTSGYPQLSDRTRTSVLFSHQSVSDALRVGEVADVCTTATTVDLSACRKEGKILQLDFPVKKYGKAGQVIQALIKHIWEKEMETQSYDPDEDNVRPGLILIDEAQFFLTEQDVAFFSSTRASRVCGLVATQSIAALRQRLGGDAAEQLLGALQTKIGHACDGETAQWMADLINQDWRYRASVSGDGSVSVSEEKRYRVEPIAFSELKRGGPENGFICEAYVFKPGARWGPNGENYRKVSFPQLRRR